MNLKERFSSFQIVVVPDAETGKKVPEIPGLLEYRKDTKELYLRANKTWKIIAPEKKVFGHDIYKYINGSKYYVSNFHLYIYKTNFV
jgi:hypothetical protein